MGRLKSLFEYKCPKCEQERVFVHRKPFRFVRIHEHCPNCKLKIEKEPGFFFGAMYVSYGLAILECGIAFAISRLFLQETFDLRILWVWIPLVFVTAPFNYKFSRILWIYLFNPKSKFVQ